MTIDAEPEATALAAEIERIEALIRSPALRDLAGRQRDGHAIRPRDAATLVVIDKTISGHRVLMGRRNRSLRFMPGALVFPGGSVDRADGTIAAADDLNPATQQRLVANMRGRPSPRRARAFGMAALRELSEESGILIGRQGGAAPSHPDWAAFGSQGIAPALGELSVLARAITPPGPPRRFDTWFFAVPASAIAHVPDGGFRPSGELEELAWLTPQEAIGGATREITRVMLVELMHRLKRDPGLDAGYPAPFYRSVRSTFRKEII